MNTKLARLATAVETLSNSNPYDPEVQKVAAELVEAASFDSVDMSELSAQVKKLHSAATVPAKNYSKIMSITSGLNRAVIAAKNSDEATKQRLASLIQKVAGIFAECDTADELASHSLTEIEAAVHRLYNNGKQNDPHTYDFVERGAGHHTK